MSAQNELTTETLDLFGLFIEELASLSGKMGQRLHDGGPEPQVHKLIDGLEVVAEAIGQVKIALEVRETEETRLLEAELGVILGELLAASETPDSSVKAEILVNRLPEHLRAWSAVGIPSLRAAQTS